MSEPTSGRVQSDAATITVCAEQVWLDGMYRVDCGHHVVNGACIRHGKDGATKNAPARTPSAESVESP